jgi:hypothetical protein
MKLLITGVSHKTAPVEVMLCLPRGDAPAASDLKSREGASEAVILPPVTAWKSLTTEDEADLRAIGRYLLTDRCGHFKRYALTLSPRGRAAIHHLPRGRQPDSMVGEPQIPASQGHYAAARIAALCVG